jgi:hypothetical protein
MNDRDCTHDRFLPVGWLDLKFQSRLPCIYYKNTILYLHTIDYLNGSSLQSGVSAVTKPARPNRIHNKNTIPHLKSIDCLNGTSLQLGLLS